MLMVGASISRSQESERGMINSDVKTKKLSNNRGDKIEK